MWSTILYAVLIVLGIYAVYTGNIKLKMMEAYADVPAVPAAVQPVVAAQIAATAQPSQPIVVLAPTVALNSPTASLTPQQAANPVAAEVPKVVAASLAASPVIQAATLTQAQPVVAPASVVAAAVAPSAQLAPQYCGAAGGLPNFVAPDYVAACTSHCKLNQTVIPEFCECACARSQAYVMGIGL